jgi:hypothetical protein
MTENLYELTDFNPIGSSDKKTRIILTETKRGYRDYILSLKYRYNKKNPYLPNYVITKGGEIYNIIKPDQYSNYMVDEEVNKTSIIIALENLGWLKKNTLSETYVNWIGDIYKDKVFEKKWRDYFFWDPYNKEQMVVLSKLLIELCDKFNIPKKTLGYNVKYEGVENFKGVVTRSNFDSIYKDTNPSFNFKLLNELLEND